MRGHPADMAGTVTGTEEAEPDAAGTVLAQHRAVRAVLDALAAQPRVTEQIQAGQLRNRQELLSALAATYAPGEALRERYLWPAVTAGWRDGRGIRAELRRQSRAIEHLMVKLRWFGDRDAEIDDVLAELDDALRAHLRFETEQLGRHLRDPDAPDLEPVGRRMRRRRWRMPTRPHPDLPIWAPATYLLRLPLFVVDRVADATRFRATGT